MISRYRIKLYCPKRLQNPDKLVKEWFKARYGTDSELIFFPNARSALYFGLLQLPIEYVVLPAFTCKCVLEAVLFANKKPVFIDVNQKTCLIDKTSFNGITLSSNHAVLITHQFGFPAPIDEIKSICQTYGAIFIEDCAASIGTCYKDRYIGTDGYFSIFSGDIFKFTPVPLGLGVLMTKDETLVSRIRKCDSYASKKYSLFEVFKSEMLKWFLVFIGNSFLYRFYYYFHFKLHNRTYTENKDIEKNIQQKFYKKTTIRQLLYFYEQLMYIDKKIEKRKEIATYYYQKLKKMKNCHILNMFEHSISKLAILRFPIFIKEELHSAFYKKCVKYGLDLGRVFPFPLPGSETKCKNALKIANTIFNLPFYENLKEDEIKKIVYIIKIVDKNIK